MKYYLLSLLLILLVNDACTQAKQFSYGSEKRRYTVYLPTSYYEKKEQVFPLVFNFHGGGMTMTEQMFYSKMNDAADKHHFIVVYPQGIKQDWNVGFDMSYQKGTDDVGFISALLEKLVKDHRIDTAKVYATGFSRGGFFCQRLAAELPQKFAAIASVGGTLPDSVAHFHKSKIPVGVMIVHGTSDDIVNYAGKPNAYRSATAAFDYWKVHNRLQVLKEAKRAINSISNDSTSVEIVEISGKDVSISLVTIVDGGHTWPGSHPFNIGFPLGKTTREININDIMWKFFARHKRSIGEKH